MIKLKIDILQELKKAGYNTTRIRKEHLFSENVITDFRKGIIIKLSTLNKLCIMLRCQPSDIIEVIPSDEEKIRFF